MIAAVARAHGVPFRAQIRESYAATLWAWWQSQEAEAFARLSAAWDRLTTAQLTNLAMWDPTKLDEEAQTLRLKSGLVPTPADARADGLKLAEEFALATGAAIARPASLPPSEG